MKPHLRNRAEAYAGEMWKYRAILLATELLAPSEQGRELAREIRGRIEGSFGKSTPLEKAIARGFHLSGRFREFRTRHWGDAIQPRTRKIDYF